MAEPFSHQNRGRSPLKIGLLVFGMAMTAMAVATEAPWSALVPIVLFTALIAWPVVADRSHGLTIGGGRIAWTVAGSETAYALPQIRRMTINHWSDSTDVALEITCRESVAIPSVCGPQRLLRLIEAAKRHGIEIIED